MSYQHPEAFAGRSVMFTVEISSSSLSSPLGPLLTHFLAHPTPLFIALHLHITSAFIVSDVLYACWMLVLCSDTDFCQLLDLCH